MSLRSAPAAFRVHFFLGAAACAAILGYALYAQFVGGFEPCPMCIFQRLAFAALGLVFLLGGLHAPRGVGARKTYGVIAVLAALVGIGIAGKHVWVQVFPPPMPSCAPGWDYMVETKAPLEIIKTVLGAKGDCSAIDWTFLGLSMPAWSLVCFVALGSWALWAALRRTGVR